MKKDDIFATMWNDDDESLEDIFSRPENHNHLSYYIEGDKKQYAIYTNNTTGKVSWDYFNKENIEYFYRDDSLEYEYLKHTDIPKNIQDKLNELIKLDDIAKKHGQQVVAYDLNNSENVVVANKEKLFETAASAMFQCFYYSAPISSLEGCTTEIEKNMDGIYGVQGGKGGRIDMPYSYDEVLYFNRETPDEEEANDDWVKALVQLHSNKA